MRILFDALALVKFTRYAFFQMGRVHSGLTVSNLSLQLADPFSFSKNAPEAPFIRRIFDEHGLVILKGFFFPPELRQIKGYIHHLIKLRRTAAGMESPDHRLCFDDGFLELASLHRKEIRSLYDAFRRLMPVHQIADSERMVALSKFLMKTEYVISYREKQIRMDLPEETKSFDWHQDFHFTQDSEDALVYWAPLHDVGFENGAMVVAPGSHRLGIQPLRYASGRSGFSELADYSFLSQFPQVQLPMEEGDLLIYNSLLLHRSGENRSDRTRWAMEIRHGNFDNERAVEQSWSANVMEGFAPIAARRRAAPKKPMRIKPEAEPSLTF